MLGTGVKIGLMFALLEVIKPLLKSHPLARVGLTFVMVAGIWMYSRKTTAPQQDQTVQSAAVQQPVKGAGAHRP